MLSRFECLKKHTKLRFESRQNALNEEIAGLEGNETQYIGKVMKKLDVGVSVPAERFDPGEIQHGFRDAHSGQMDELQDIGRMESDVKRDVNAALAVLVFVSKRVLL